MFPWKVVPKKGNKTSVGKISSNSSIIIPVEKGQEYSPRIQMSIVCEVLINNRQKVIDMVERDEGSFTTIGNTRIGELPPVVSVLQQTSCISKYYKQFDTSPVDEYKEIMDEILFITECGEANEKDEMEIRRDIEDSFEGLHEWPDMIRERNHQFIHENDNLDDRDHWGNHGLDLRFSEEEEEVDIGSTLDNNMTIFQMAKFDLFIDVEPDSFDHCFRAAQSKISPLNQGQLRSPLNTPNMYDYTYYRFRIERNVLDVQKEDREDNEISTKSDGQRDERDITVDRFKKEESKDKDDYEENHTDETRMEQPSEPQNIVSQSEISAKNKKKKKKKHQKTVITIFPIEPLTLQYEYLYIQLLKHKEQDKQLVKVKKDFKEQLKDMLAQASEVENIEEFEKKCIDEINSQPSISKKMKQKARKGLRNTIERLKENKRNSSSSGEMEQDMDDEYVDDEEVESFQGYVYPDISNEKYLELIGLNANTMQYLHPNDFIKFNALLERIPEHTINERKSSKFDSPLKSSRKNSSKPSEKDYVTPKWKEKLFDTIKKSEMELGKHKHKLEKATHLNRLYSEFKDSKIKPLMNILHEGSVGLNETVQVERRKKETRFIFALPNSSHLPDIHFP